MSGRNINSDEQTEIRDNVQAATNDEGADPRPDIEQQSSKTPNADQVSEDDPHKAEKLVKAGRDIDPNAGAD